MLASALGVCLVLNVGFGQMFSQPQGGAIDPKALAKAEKEYLVAKKAYDRHHSPGAKQALVVAGDRYALSSMYASTLPPKVKYRQALRLYREVLKIDPANREAKNNSNLIISIYHSMHRPVPN
jgi:hypothetical protein